MLSFAIESPRSAREMALALIFALAICWVPTPASAQRVPAENVLEIVIKRNLMSFNDANLTAKYEVWHAMLSRPFQQRYGPEQLKSAFKAFNDKQVDIAPILLQRPVLSEPARIDQDGALLLKGSFETRPSRVVFDMRLMPTDGDWKLMALQVNVVPVGEASRGGASGRTQ